MAQNNENKNINWLCITYFIALVSFFIALTIVLYFKWFLGAIILPLIAIIGFIIFMYFIVPPSVNEENNKE